MTDHVPAAAEGLPNLNRRSLLLGIAAAPVITLPTVAVARATTAQERLQSAIAELKAAAYEVWPDIVHINERVGVAGDKAEAAPIILVMCRPPQARIVPFHGPGLYECLDRKTGKQPVYWVEKTPKGFRCAHWWKGKPQGGWRRYSESRLQLIRVLEG